ncbi:MAG: hypothetical protein Q4A31_05695 [Corynebacterium sp.]|uniref:hypothetical protein n=1 Tax=Corynebacterium sp. TaxID=1720 RepID=UPI0026DB704C|nr:hypothetical protein [Corynebacterium sp.]MDO4761392.1 hypothetical protein [Corynebacterium sp.]
MKNLRTAFIAATTVCALGTSSVGVATAAPPPPAQVVGQIHPTPSVEYTQHGHDPLFMLKAFLSGASVITLGAVAAIGVLGLLLKPVIDHLSSVVFPRR